MVTLPSLAGTELRAVLESLGVKQSEVAAICDCSLPTIQRLLSSSNPIRSYVATRLAPELLLLEQVALELGLSYRAIHRATQRGLVVHRGALGEVFWRPQARQWAARLTASANSLESRATQLAGALEFDVEEGVLSCELCTDGGAASPGIAFRQCAFCGRRVCWEAACASEVLTADDAERVACAECFMRRRKELFRVNAFSSLLPGEQASDELARRFELLSATGTPAELQRLRARAASFLAYFTQHLKAIDAYLAKEIAPAAGVPDLNAPVRLARRQARREAELLNGLLERMPIERTRRR